MKNEDGSRKFDAGNLAIHAFDVDFVDRIVGENFTMPFRRADKKVAHIDEDGKIIEPDSPNAVKLETFIFDALPLAKNALVLETKREEEFSPVKNATGVDSMESSKRDQNRRSARWLRAAGNNVKINGEGEPTVNITIMPTFAMDQEELKTKASNIGEIDQDIILE